MARVAIAGASGFVGVHLARRLAGHDVVALSRSQPGELPPWATWRKTELFSAESTFGALEGIDVAVYLVHSMMPSSRLFQGNFHDTDLLLADNFARAAKAQGVKRIIYLGGMVPEGRISQHLESRREVEGVLGSTGVPTTVLRAGMVVGPGGSSFEILRALVQRLPVMLLPRWARRTTQAVFIDDVVDVIAAAIEDPELASATIDLVNGEPLTYESLLRRTARVLGLQRAFLPVPIESTEFSKLWVTWFGNSTRELVSPLIDSLVCDLPQSAVDPRIATLVRYRTFEAMLEETLRREGPTLPPRPRRKGAVARSVRSIQRLPSVRAHDSEWIAREYMRWLPRIFAPFIRVETDAGFRVRFTVPLLRKPLLELQFVAGRFDADRQKFHIVGGLLTRTVDTGWLEFRQVRERTYTLAAIHEFVPSLPWYIYVLSQAPVHAWVMHAFGRHLAGIVTTHTTRMGD